VNVFYYPQSLLSIQLVLALDQEGVGVMERREGCVRNSDVRLTSEQLQLRDRLFTRECLGHYQEVALLPEQVGEVYGRPSAGSGATELSAAPTTVANAASHEPGQLQVPMRATSSTPVPTGPLVLPIPSTPPNSPPGNDEPITVELPPASSGSILLPCKSDAKPDSSLAERLLEHVWVVTPPGWAEGGHYRYFPDEKDAEVREMLTFLQSLLPPVNE
jgi:hypothetical protein